MKRVFSLVLLILFFPAPSLSSQTVSIDSFVKPYQFTQIKLSPDGEKLAAISLENSRRVLVLMTLDPMEITYVLRFVDHEEVGDFYWANKDRIVTSVHERAGWQDDPSYSGTLYALNYDGSRQKTVFGYNVAAEQQTGSRVRVREAIEAYPEIISRLKDDDKYILVNAIPWASAANRRNRAGSGGNISDDSWRDRVNSLYKINVYNGRSKKLGDLPGRGCTPHADAHGNLWFAWCKNGDDVSQAYRRVGKKWEALGNLGSHHGITPVSYSDDGKFAYLLMALNSDKDELVRFERDTGILKTIVTNDRVDIEKVMNYPGSDEPMAVIIEDGKPSYQFMDKNQSATKMFRGVLKAFPDYRVKLSSSSDDGTLAIITVDGDDIPTDFYLLNFETKQVEFLLSSASWLDPASLNKKQTFDIESRDGLKLQGYLTFPKSVTKPLPMVVVPHGGPNSRDYWAYDRRHQILSAEGFLVLSVNFRGSTGYGDAFRDASDGNWGTRVQDDIADATQWAVEQGYADSDRICIFGSGFGAYSALMSVIRYPELYQCAAGYAGVYDLGLLYKAGDIQRSRSGEAYLKESLGNDSEELEKYSPVNYGKEIRVPVFLAHGGEDRRAPIAHAKSLARGIREGGGEVTTLYYDRGGHGYISSTANRELYSGLIAFLNQHLNNN